SIHMFSQVRKDVRHHFAALTSRRECEGRLHQVTDGILKKSGRVLKLRVEFSNRLAVPFRQLRPIIPRVDGTGPPVDKDPDDSLSPGRKVSRLRREWIP